jgi:phosphoribosylanthranilate isomerase
MRTRVKICGITSEADANAVVDAGADALGFIFCKESRRYIKPAEAAGIVTHLPPFVTPVGVFVNETLDGIVEAARTIGLGAVQLHGDEGPSFVEEIMRALPGVPAIKAFRVKTEKDIDGLKVYGASAFLLDAFSEKSRGGTGETFDWELAVKAKRFGRIMLAGGLGPDNIVEAVSKVSPYAVDVSSGVETSPGRKDHAKIKKLMDRIRAHEKNA